MNKTHQQNYKTCKGGENNCKTQENKKNLISEKKNSFMKMRGFLHAKDDPAPSSKHPQTIMVQSTATLVNMAALFKVHSERPISINITRDFWMLNLEYFQQEFPCAYKHWVRKLKMD